MSVNQQSIFPVFLFMCLMFLLGCNTHEPGKKMNFSSKSEINKNLYQSHQLDGQRIAIEGYIRLKNWRERNAEIYCEFVDKNQEQLFWITLPKSNRNSVDLGKTGFVERKNNMDYVEVDKSDMKIIDNEGNRYSIDTKILLTFDIAYAKNMKTKKYIEQKTDSNNIKSVPTFEGANLGDSFFLFTGSNFRIDKL